MKNLFIIFPLLILINSCKSVKHEEDFPENFNDKLYFQLDEKFVDEIIPKLKDSHLKFLDLEKQSYLSKGLNEPNYLKSIEWDYNSFEVNKVFCLTYFTKCFCKLINNTAFFIDIIACFF